MPSWPQNSSIDNWLRRCWAIRCFQTSANAAFVLRVMHEPRCEEKMKSPAAYTTAPRMVGLNGYISITNQQNMSSQRC